MGFIGLFLLILALSELPSSVPVGSALNLSGVIALSSTSATLAAGSAHNLRNETTKSSTSATLADESTALLPSAEPEMRGKRPRKKHMSCKRNPKSCERFSKHHSCCFKLCVNVSANTFHCGSCGHVCKHGMRCCNGVCVDIRKDRSHCGKCRNVCLPGESCAFGMCGYG